MSFDTRHDAGRILRNCLENWDSKDRQPFGSFRDVITAIEELRTSRAVDAIPSLRELYYLVDVPDPLDQPSRNCEHERLRDRLFAALRELGEPADQVAELHPSHPSCEDGRTLVGDQTRRLVAIATEAVSEAARAWALYHLARTDAIAAWPTLVDAFKRSPSGYLCRLADMSRSTSPSKETEAFETTPRCAQAACSALRFRDDRDVDVELWRLVRDPASKRQVRFWALASLSSRPIYEEFEFRVPIGSALPTPLREDILQYYLPADPLDDEGGWRMYPDIDLRWLIERMHLPVRRSPSAFRFDPDKHRDETAAALKSALASAGYDARFDTYVDHSGILPKSAVEVFLSDEHRGGSVCGDVSVWLSTWGPYATLAPNQCLIGSGDGWARTERLAEVASDVATAHGWYWLNRAMASTVFPGFHFERWCNLWDDDEENPTVMHLLFS